MKTDKTENELYNILVCRYERLIEEYKLNAPEIVKTLELQLIAEAALELKELLSKNIKE